MIEPVVDVHIDEAYLAHAFRHDIVSGLTASPKELPPKWAYDETGSELFDRITRLDEYYLTEAERQILLTSAPVIIDDAAPEVVVELGAGTSDKTTALLDAAMATGRLQRFIPFDVSEEFLRASASKLATRYPGLLVHGVVGDFDVHLGEIPSGGRRLVVLLGSTLGNYPPAARGRFLRAIADTMAPGDHLLLGTDLVKAPGRLEPAYDDSLGVSAAFNKNCLLYTSPSPRDS